MEGLLSRLESLNRDSNCILFDRLESSGEYMIRVDGGLLKLMGRDTNLLILCNLLLDFVIDLVKPTAHGDKKHKPTMSGNRTYDSQEHLDVLVARIKAYLDGNISKEVFEEGNEGDSGEARSKENQKRRRADQRTTGKKPVSTVEISEEEYALRKKQENYRRRRDLKIETPSEEQGRNRGRTSAQKHERHRGKKFSGENFEEMSNSTSPIEDENSGNEQRTVLVYDSEERSVEQEPRGASQRVPRQKGSKPRKAHRRTEVEYAREDDRRFPEDTEYKKEEGRNKRAHRRDKQYRAEEGLEEGRRGVPENPYEEPGHTRHRRRRGDQQEQRIVFHQQKEEIVRIPLQRRESGGKGRERSEQKLFHKRNTPIVRNRELGIRQEGYGGEESYSEEERGESGGGRSWEGNEKEEDETEHLMGYLARGRERRVRGLNR
jgi:ribosomal protein L32